MIPKIIHFCWFGHNPLPESALKCINSWKKFFPDYEIWQWSEDSLTSKLSTQTSNDIADKIMPFDVNIIPYTKDAYEAKKYAFVSDYARFYVLEKYGGLYFDTDVEIIKSMDDIVTRGPFFGIEVDGNEKKGTLPAVAPGLCLGAEAHMSFYKQINEGFEHLNFYLDDGSWNNFTMIPMVSKMLVELGMQPHNKIQEVGDFTLYPAEYFNPLEIATGRLKISKNTRSIHWFMASWMAPQPVWKKKLKQYIRRVLYLFKK